MLRMNKQMKQFFQDNEKFIFFQDYLVLHYLSKYKRINMMNVECPKEFLTLLDPECLAEDSEDLLGNVICVSSMDRKEECAENILQGPSSCLSVLPFLDKPISELSEYDIFLGYQLQRRCGCTGGRPCYWGSAESRNQNATEYITFQLTTTLAFITQFSVTSYQAFFHERAPVYAPQLVALQFLLPSNTPVEDYAYDYLERKHRQNNNFPEKYHCPMNIAAVYDQVYYTTPFFEMENNARQQIFPLVEPVVCLGGVIRLLICGMHQRQTIEDMDDYYCCISHATVQGVSDPDFELQVLNEKTDRSNLTEMRDCQVVYHPKTMKSSKKTVSSSKSSHNDSKKQKSGNGSNSNSSSGKKQSSFGGLWGFFS
jgi:hypothetical protein